MILDFDTGQEKGLVGSCYLLGGLYASYMAWLGIADSCRA